mgnify:CR=1 FL=1
MFIFLLIGVNVGSKALKHMLSPYHVNVSIAKEALKVLAQKFSQDGTMDHVSQVLRL